MKRIIKRAGCAALSMMLVMGSIGIPSYAQDQEILETVEESISESNEVDGPDAESEEPDRDVKEEEVEKTVEQEEKKEEADKRAENVEKGCAAEGSVSIESVYGDSDFSLNDYISIDERYDGSILYNVQKGQDVVSPDGDGNISIKGAGSASLKVFFCETDEFKESYVTVSITVKKRQIGSVCADDIEWDNTEKAYDADNKMEVAGTLKKSVGVMDGDIIGVVAHVTTESEKPGKWGSAIEDISFIGAENYEIDMSGNGPEITIINLDPEETEETAIQKAPENASATQVRISYDDNAPINGSYFANDRVMTATVTTSEFDESLVSMRIGVNGDEETYPLSMIRSGAVSGVSLIRGPETIEEATQFSILFGGQDEKVENTYTVSLSYDGTEADAGDSACPDKFVIDEVSPVMNISFTRPDGESIYPATAAEGSVIVDGSVTAAISVKENNFRGEGVKVSVTAKDAEGNDTDAYPETSADKPSTSEWNSEGSNHGFTMDLFEKDSNYSLQAECTDLAGNTAIFGPGYFTVDTEAPSGKIMVKTSDGQEKEYYKVLEEKERQEGIFQHVFGLFDKNVTLLGSAEDTASGVKSVQYYLSDIAEDAGAEFSQKADLENLEWKDWKEGTKIDTDRILVVYEKITDKAGHVTYISSGGGIAVDTKEPGAPDITIESAYGTMFSSDFDVRISSTDPDNGGEGVYSGMKKISYKIVNNLTGEVTLEGEKTADEPRMRTLEEELRVPVDGNNSNAVTLTVTAEDYAGNTSVKERTFSCDSTAPVIDIDFDDSGVSNGHYFKETREIKTVFKERNFSPERSKLMVKTDGKTVSLNMEQLMDGQGSEYGITVKNMEDTEKNIPWNERTDNREITYVILFGNDPSSDREYEGLRFTSEDDAGNKAEKAEDKYAVFTVDKIAPVVSVRYTSGGQDVTGKIGTNDKAPYYTQDSVTPSITVTDHNFTKNGVTVQVSQKDSSGNDMDSYGNDSISAPQVQEWKKDGESHSFTMDAFRKDANYGLGLEVKDLAGNIAEGYDHHYFTVDNTSPTGAIIVTSGDGSGTYTGFSGSIRFVFMDNAAIAVANRADDETSGVASVSYYKYTPPVYARGIFSGLSLKKLRSVDWRGWNGSLYVTPDSQAVIYARIIDRAGNIAYINTEGAMIADHTKPSSPEISINAAAPSGGIYRADVPVSVSVEDVLSGGTFSGLSEVTIEVLSNGSVTQNIRRRFSPKEDRQQIFAEDIVVNAARNNSNNVLLRVTARDYAGNVSGMEKSLKIDITAPRIEVAYDNNDPVNGRYYDKTRTATVTVYERNFDPSGVSFRITGSPRISGWTIGSGAGQSDDAANTCTIIYDEDAEYAFTMSVEDIAGNSASYGKTDRFVVDKTDPIIKVTYDNNAVKNGKYYSSPRTAFITITDLSFDEDLFNARVKASLDGRGIGTPKVNGWSHSGNDHTASISFASDGDYSFTLDCTDLAGNRSQTYAQGEFTVDMTKPAITFFDIVSGSANSGEAAPGIRYEDLNIGEKRVRILLRGIRHREKEVTGTYEKLAHGGSIKLDDIAHTIAEDDVYTITASVEDLAGNETVETITFSVNRFGSTYYFSDMTAAYLDKRYNKDGSSIVIYEVNVNNVHDNAVTIYHDGKAITPTAEMCRIEEVSEKDDWKKYMYSLDAALFAEEGTYEILVSSVDEAGNRQDNKIKDVPVLFVVDRTPPSAVITGVEDGEYYDEKSREAVIMVTDNVSMGSLKVLIDDKEVATYTAEQIAQAEGKISVILKESDEWQTISLQFEDAAGNTGTAHSCRVLVTTNAVTRILHSRLWLWLLVLAAGCGTYVTVKKKKAGN